MFTVYEFDVESGNPVRELTFHNEAVAMASADYLRGTPPVRLGHTEVDIQRERALPRRR